MLTQLGSACCQGGDAAARSVIRISEAYAKPAHLETTTAPERGHSCPQQRWKAHQVWKTVSSHQHSRLAADRNVRAPVAACDASNAKPAAWGSLTTRSKFSTLNLGRVTLERK